MLIHDVFIRATIEAHPHIHARVDPHIRFAVACKILLGSTAGYTGRMFAFGSQSFAWIAV